MTTEIFQINDRHATVGAHVFSDQRNCDLRIVYVRSGQHCADGNLSIGYVQVQFVPTPVLVVTVARFFRADAAETSQFREHFVEFHGALPLQSRRRIARFARFASQSGSDDAPSASRCLLQKRIFPRRLPDTPITSDNAHLFLEHRPAARQIA
jgi:hypothetical protein